MRFTFEHQILIFLIIWVVGYSTVLRFYFTDTHGKNTEENRIQVEMLQKQLEICSEEKEAIVKQKREAEKLLMEQSDDRKDTSKPIPKQPDDDKKGEVIEKPKPKTSVAELDTKSTAKDYVEKVSGMKIVEYFRHILTESSRNLTLRERKRGGVSLDLPIQEWMFEQQGKYESVPYQITVPANEPKPPATIKATLPPKSVIDEVDRVCKLLESKNHQKLSAMFRKCYPNTLETTTALLEDGTTYIITGDIDLMWLRDSSAQVHQYLASPFLVGDPEMQRIVEGLIKRQSIFIQKSPYGSSFRLQLRPEDDLSDFHVSKARNIYVSMHNYELDSLCYHVWLSYQWWKVSGRTNIFDDEWQRVAHIIVALMIVEQHHKDLSPYRYKELTRDRGKWSSPVEYTGMTWTAFRPSDDQTMYGYLIPSNMFAVVALNFLEEIAREIYKDDMLQTIAFKLRNEIDEGIHKHGVVNSDGKKIYAYEVDGLGHSNLMDDANVPSLLSIEYIGYKSKNDPNGEIAKNTRQFILSRSNPYYYEGSSAAGIGSPHTPNGNIWPMSIIMKGLTSTDLSEVAQVFKVLSETDANTNFMHESFHHSNPTSYTRYWFAWANSLFSELVLKHMDSL